MPKSRRRRSSGATREATSGNRSLSGLGRLSVADLQREVRRRQRGAAALHRRRAKVLAKIEALDAQILAAGGSLDGRAARGGGGGRVRRRNENTLVESLDAAKP